jgi:hypothetical protein
MQLVARGTVEGIADQGVRIVDPERAEAEVDEQALAVRRLERGQQRRREPGPEGQPQQQTGARWPPQQVLEQLERRAVGPL